MKPKQLKLNGIMYEKLMLSLEAIAKKHHAKLNKTNNGVEIKCADIKQRQKVQCSFEVDNATQKVYSININTVAIPDSRKSLMGGLVKAIILMIAPVVVIGIFIDKNLYTIEKFIYIGFILFFAIVSYKLSSIIGWFLGIYYGIGANPTSTNTNRLIKDIEKYIKHHEIESK